MITHECTKKTDCSATHKCFSLTKNVNISFSNLLVLCFGHQERTHKTLFPDHITHKTTQLPLASLQLLTTLLLSLTSLTGLWLCLSLSHRQGDLLSVGCQISQLCRFPGTLVCKTLSDNVRHSLTISGLCHSLSQDYVTHCRTSDTLTYCHAILSLTVSHCHSLSLTVTHCHSLSLTVTHCNSL